MSEVIELLAEERNVMGTGPARALRRRGFIPAIIYGCGNQPAAVAVPEKEVMKYYRRPQFISTVFEVKTNNKTIKVLPKQIDLDPITDIARHIDFVYLNTDFQVMEVPLVFENREKSLGVKRGGYFNIIKRTITLKCPVNNLPKKISIDTTNMQIGYSLKAKNLKLPEGCALVNESNFVIASVTGRGGKADAAEASEGAAKE